MWIRRSALGAAVGVGLLSLLAPLTPAHAATTPLGVTLYENGTQLGRFNTTRPWDMTPIGGAITGLVDDSRLVGIDRRVQNGRLYGVGNEGGIYRMASNRATKVGELSIDLEGASFGVDFNPAANALRIVSDADQNLRQPFPLTGDAPTVPTIADTDLAYTPVADPVVGAKIIGAAYTNNDLDATTATTLFDLDTEQEQIAIQAPANAGTLSPTGKLGVGAGVEAGFDIFSEVSSGKTVANHAFATVPTGTANRLHKVDLLTGDLTYVGMFPERVTDIALDIDS